MMAVATGAVLTRATRPAGFRCAPLLLVALSFGCVDLSKPQALANPDGAAGSRGRGDASAGAGGTGPASSEGTGGASDSSAAGTGGSDSGGSASGGIAFDAGVGGSTSPSTSGRDANGGNTEIDAPLTDLPPATGGVVPDAGTGGSGGSAGKTGSAGSSGLDAGAGSSGAGKTSSAGRTAGSSGTAGQGGGGTGGAAGGRDAAVPDAAPPDAPCALCAIGATLVHRYSFSGTGTTVTDSVGTAHGSVKNAQLSGSGTVVLAGGTTNQYVELPAKILSTLTSATLEIWVTWTGGNNNQRILDFGSNKTSGSTTSAVSTVIISPNSSVDSVARLRASYCSDTSVADSSIFADATSTLATGTMAQIVAVFDGQNDTITMYLNGALQDEGTGLGALSQINDVNNWLGKSQYSNDPGFAGTYHEFRIYNAPLTAAQVQAVYTAGTNASFTQ